MRSLLGSIGLIGLLASPAIGEDCAWWNAAETVSLYIDEEADPQTVTLASADRSLTETCELLPDENLDGVFGLVCPSANTSMRIHNEFGSGPSVFEVNREFYAWACLPT